MDTTGSVLKVKTMDDFVALVRHFMRDYPQLNKLLSSEETRDRTIKLLTVLAIDEFNTLIGIKTTYTFEKFPSYSLLLHKVVGEILLSASLLQFRNQHQYNVNGVSVSFSDKGQIYINLYQTFMQMWDRYANKLKVQINITDAFSVSGVNSEYAYLYSYWYGAL